MPDALATNCTDASWAGVVFPVASIKNEEGHGIVGHEAYGRPGADQEPTGRKPWRGTLVVPLFNDASLVARYGTLYPGLWTTLRAALRAYPLATFVHPTLGAFQAACTGFSWSEEPTRRNGVTMQISVVEHDASVDEAVGINGDAPTDAATQAPLQAAGADTAMDTAVEGTLLVPSVMGPAYATAVALLLSTTLTYTEIVSQFASLFALLNANLALLDGLTMIAANAVAIHDARVALEQLRATTLNLQALLIPSASATRTYVTPRQMADWEVAVAVYGDFSLAGLIRAANSISDWSAIPMGRALTILPSTS